MNEKSEQINELALALSKAQAEMGSATKNSVNPHFKSRYADLASVIDACREALSKHGLSVAQMPTGDGQTVGLTTTLMHSSGQWMSSTLSAKIDQQKATAQAVGSLITYFRRYSLAAIAGVAAEEDDDGNAATAAAPRELSPTRPQEILKPKQEVKHDIPANVYNNGYSTTPVDSAEERTDATLIRLGNAKGKHLADADDSTILWLLGVYRENVNDSSKAKFKNANAKFLLKISEEMAKRGLREE